MSKLPEQFTKDLTEVLIKHSIGEMSDTPNYLLCDYITGIIESFTELQNRRDRWYGLAGREVVEAGNNWPICCGRPASWLPDVKYYYCAKCRKSVGK